MLYINDIVLSSEVFKFTLFADDTSLFYSHKNKTDAVIIINQELAKISEWLAANKLSLNVGKSQLLIFSNKKNPENAGDIIMNGEKLEEVDHAKYLGVLVDNKLNWSHQINAVNLKLSKVIGLLAKIRHYVPSGVPRSLYFSFMNPYIDYNLLNWGMAAPTNLNPLNLKLKKAVRIISFVKDSDYPSVPLFKDLKILPLTQSIEFKYAKFMWKLKNGVLPNCLSSNFTPNVRTQYSMSFSRLESVNRFILYEGPKIWNGLPVNITNKPSITSFSNSLKSHILSSL